MERLINKLSLYGHDTISLSKPMDVDKAYLCYLIANNTELEFTVIENHRKRQDNGSNGDSNSGDS